MVRATQHRGRRRRRAVEPWGWFLAGPLLATVHFLVVYLGSEVACAGDDRPGDLAGVAAPSFGVLAVTAVALVAVLAVCAGARAAARTVPSATQEGTRGPETSPDTHPDADLDRHRQGDGGNRRDEEAPDRFLARMGVGLALLSAGVVLAVGLPAAVLEPC